MSRDSFSTVLLEIWESQSNCDVKFICADPNNSSEKSSIQAHQLILSLSSDVFKAMFFGPLVKNKSEFADPGINIPDIEFSIFMMVLGFMYGKQIELENVKTACDFYYAVHKYNCKDALNFVMEYLLKEMNAENCIFIYQETEKFNNNKLREACLEKFGFDTCKTLVSDQFLEADPQTIVVMFALDSLTIESEKDLITALERYIKHNKTDDPEIAAKVRPALQKIRFLTLPANQIIRTTLLTMEEKHCIIEGLEPDSNLTNMPEGFSLNANKRCSIQQKKIIQALSDVFSSKTCFYCAKFLACGCLHAIWNCSSSGHLATGKVVLQAIFKKYNHVSLMEYDPVDLKSVHTIYKSWKYVD